MSIIINGRGRVGVRSNVSNGGGGASYLLDTYGGAAAAYSLRKLSSTYSGNAIRVRRSSDNTETNIGFDGSGNLDESALTSFVGAGDGFVTTWYDQSGNVNHSTQTSATNQPQIVSSGNIVKVLGTTKPMIKFGTSSYLDLTTLINVDGTDSSQFMTYQKSSTGANIIAWQNGAYFTWLNYGNVQYYGNSYIVDADFNTANELMLVGITMDYGVKLEFFKNNISQQTKTSAFSAEQRFNTLFPLSGAKIESYCNEFIFYSSDQNSNASGIQTNINTYYSIY